MTTEIIRCQVCERCFSPDDEPLCPHCAAYVPKAFDVIIRQRQQYEQPARCVHNNTPESGCDWCRIYAESHPEYDKDNEQHEQPAPEDEEWRSVNMTDTAFDHQPVITIEQGDKLLATAYSFETAEQIIRDHRLTALVPELVEALRKARATAQIRSDLHRQLYGSPTTESWVTEADAVLNAVAKEREGERT